jgi:hypothetical protein
MVCDNSETFPKVFKVSSISQTVPINSVDCERAFSTQNIIKTKQRASIGIQTLDWLKRVKLHGKNLLKNLTSLEA